MGVEPLRVGINGFGRIGRLAFRVAWGRDDIEVVQVNELAGDARTAAHLLEFDSVHGRWGQPVTAGAGVGGGEASIETGGRAVRFTRSPEPGGAGWGRAGVDVVLECTGAFRKRGPLEAHLAAGARRVLVAAPVHEPGVPNVVVGCNDGAYDPDKHPIATAASCTTNCLAPVVKVVHRGLGVERGTVTTLHDVTNTQVVVDAPHKDLRRARSALMSLIPTSTGSATAIGLIFPELEGRLDGVAVRVPLLNASLTDAVFEVSRPTTVDEVNTLFREAAGGDLRGILGYEERPLVSVDYVNDPRSGIVDAGSTMVVDGTLVKVLAWYDNEWGYANRLVELAARRAN